MEKATFDIICHEIRPYIEKKFSASYPAYYFVELFLMQGICSISVE